MIRFRKLSMSLLLVFAATASAAGLTSLTTAESTDGLRTALTQATCVFLCRASCRRPARQRASWD
jgi:hypothetical protein